MAKFMGKINIDDFKKVIEAPIRLSYEPTIKIRKDGFHIEEADSMSPTIILSIFIPKNMFDKYDYSEDLDITFRGSVFQKNLKNLSGIILLGTDGARVKMRSLETNKTFELRLVVREDKWDVEKFVKTMGEYTAEAKFKVPVNDLKSAFSDAMQLFEPKDWKPCTLIAGKKGLILKSEAGDGFNKFEQPILKQEFAKEVNARFLLDQINNALTSAVGEDAEIQFAQDHPLKMDFKSEEGIEMSAIFSPLINKEGT